MISRHWKGLCKPQFADRYVEHLEVETFPQLVNLPGFVRATILRRILPDGVEFQIVTLWDSLSAIEAFAGRDSEVAVVPESVRAMMLSYDHRVAHYEIAYQIPVPQSGGT
jgi:heme-degrading monooxygenase HmoA